MYYYIFLFACDKLSIQQLRTKILKLICSPSYNVDVKDREKMPDLYKGFNWNHCRRFNLFYSEASEFAFSGYLILFSVLKHAGFQRLQFLESWEKTWALKGMVGGSGGGWVGHDTVARIKPCPHFSQPNVVVFTRETETWSESCWDTGQWLENSRDTRPWLEKK